MILYRVDGWPVHPGAAVRIVNDDPAGEELTPPTVGSFWVLSKAQVYSDWSVCKLSKFLIFKIPTLPQNLYSIFFFLSMALSPTELHNDYPTGRILGCWFAVFIMVTTYMSNDI